MVLNPRHHDRWSGAHLVQGCEGLTSGFSFRRPSEMRVSRVFFSGPCQRCLRTRMQGVRGEMWPVSCGFAAGFSSGLLVHRAAQGMRMRCPDQRDLDGDGVKRTHSEVVLV